MPGFLQFLVGYPNCRFRLHFWPRKPSEWIPAGSRVGQFFFRPDKINLMNFSMKVVPSNTSTANLFTMPNFTRVRGSPNRRRRVMVPDTVNFVLDELYISGMSRWRMLIPPSGV